MVKNRGEKKKITNVKFVATENDKEFIRELQKDMEIVDRPFEKAAKKLGIKIYRDFFNIKNSKIIKFSKKLGIYENPNELLSISLGSAETTLLKLTSAYCSFVNGGKLINPIMIDRIQDSEGNTIFNNETRKCLNCKQISFLIKKFPSVTLESPS